MSMAIQQWVEASIPCSAPSKAEKDSTHRAWWPGIGLGPEGKLHGAACLSAVFVEPGSRAQYNYALSPEQRVSPTCQFGANLAAATRPGLRARRKGYSHDGFHCGGSGPKAGGAVCL